MKKYLYTLLVVILSNQINAQFFVPRLTMDEFNSVTGVYGINNEGDTISGKLGFRSFVDGEIRAITIKTDAGKMKFKTPDLLYVALEAQDNPLMDDKFSIPDMKRIQNKDFFDFIITDWVFFERIAVPRGNNREKWIQVANPGFDSKIKLYLDPDANQTATLETDNIKLAGGDDASYIMVKGNDDPVLLRKKDYKDAEFVSALYNGCPAVFEAFEGEELKWKDLATHVLIFDQQCK